MATRTKVGGKKDRYLELVTQFPLRPLRSAEELDRAIAVVDELTDRLDDLDAGEQDYLEVLGDLIARYEDKHVPIRPVSDDVMLRHLIEAKGVSQSQLARETGIVESTISEVLARRRKLNRTHI